MVLPLVIAVMPEGADRDYMEWLFVEHHRLMMVTAFGIVPQSADADEIVSDSLIALYKKIDKLRGMEENALRLYIVSTVRNTSLNYLKKHQRMNSQFLHMPDAVICQVPGREGALGGKGAFGGEGAFGRPASSLEAGPPQPRRRRGPRSLWLRGLPGGPPRGRAVPPCPGKPGGRSLWTPGLQNNCWKRPRVPPQGKRGAPACTWNGKPPLPAGRGRRTCWRCGPAALRKGWRARRKECGTEWRTMCIWMGNSFP